MKGDKNVSSAVVSGIEILVEILLSTPKIPYEKSKTRDSLPLSVQYVSDLIPKLVPLLDQPSHVKTSTAPKEVLGQKRLKVAELLDALVKVEYQYVDAVLTSNKAFIKLLKLFFKFENNNVLQRIVTNTFLKIFRGPSDKLKQYVRFVLLAFSFPGFIL